MKKIVLTLVIGLLAAALVGVWYFSKLPDMSAGVVTNDQNEISKETEVNEDTLTGKDSLNALLRLGKSIQCTFSFSADGLRGEGTAFYDNGLARIDSLYTDESEGDTSSYLVIDSNNEVMYSWFTQAGETQGVKLSTKATSEQTVPSVAENKPETVTPETPVQYDCKPWAVDGSVFVPPTDVEFMDMTDMQKMMEDMQKNMGALNIPNN